MPADILKNSEKIKRFQVYPWLIFAAVFYLVYAVWTDLDSLAAALADFNWFLLPFILALTFLNYLLRFAKWQYYLKNLKIEVKRSVSFKIFISGLSMSVTPGKLGEVLRSFLLKSIFQTPLSKSAPIVLADRATDLLALAVLAALGAYSFSYGRAVVLFVAAAVLLTIAVISWRRLAFAFIKTLKRLAFFQKRAGKIVSLYESSYVMLRPPSLAFATALSILGWGLEAVGFYLTFLALGIPVGVFAAVFIYSFSTILGALSAVPGGVGLTEGAMTGLLLFLKIARASAGAATLVIRLSTLWFGVLLGAVYLHILSRKFKL